MADNVVLIVSVPATIARVPSERISASDGLLRSNPASSACTRLGHNKHKADRVATDAYKVVVEVLGGRHAVQTFFGHVVAEISQRQSIGLPGGNQMHHRRNPGDLGDDVRDARDSNIRHETTVMGGRTYMTPLSTMPLMSCVSPSRNSSNPPLNLLQVSQE